ncbi:MULTISPECIES: flagellar biosynthetic protein FliO [Halopseudomonas]|uniref:Flagellar protein n=1 Tax=Halopseudomonas bauzanensis TaxID=653930 RepID=A0A031MF78_9GAMM|nr:MULTISPECIES: flagellar biosynthetic protein FliO [Halopseudomonas]EZQ19242.1 flagellar assembly protein FliO [Halopseudomonas bauzanensis]TKA90803.1 flagellar biosynthetic protein FliO [Halopseudomonas bauzanensis]WGK60634.1 flagellar biosynthetic protein FliO [Halopseudomonas sp. SMJS2]SER58880.1 flagellar protein FliO/FliZ [Halopseudomonas bauzanensis]SFL66890.1 flagellar protein FliO/FliZ [Halopseudomonas bauzanensis]
MRWSHVLLPALLAGLSTSLAAAPAGGNGEATSGLASQLTQLGLGLIVVVGLIFLLGYLMRRVGPMAPQGGQHIRVISSYPLGPRDRLALVEVGGQQMLLGISPGRINTLHVFPEPVVDTDEAATSGDFARKLQAILKREQKP